MHVLLSVYFISSMEHGFVQKIINKSMEHGYTAIQNKYISEKCTMMLIIHENF